MPARILQSVSAAVMWRARNHAGLRLAGVRVYRFEPQIEEIRSRNPDITVRLMDPPDVLALSADPRSGLNALDTRRRLAQGQFFIASFADARLVGFDWYAPGPVCLEERAISFSFDPSLICCAYSFVDPAYRGKGSGADRWDFAHRVFAGRGWRGTVYYVEGHNLASRRAAAKLQGAARRWVGMFAYCRVMGRWVCWTSPGCRRHGIMVTKRLPPNSA